jgi:hypothetical protein
MQEATQTDNILIRDDETNSDEKPFKLYDPEAQNRFEYEVRQDGFIYDIAHVFGRLGDTRYIQWLSDFKIRGNEDQVDEESMEASIRLWDDVIIAVENVEFAPDVDWKTLIPYGEKLEAVNNLLAVAIAEPDDARAKGPLRLGEQAKNQTVWTEAWFNGDVVKQAHTLRESTLEFKKEYSRIQGKRFKQEKIKGLYKRQPKVEFIPQDEKVGELYDKMIVSTEGFAGDWVPLRFKTTVMNHVFESKVDPKKSER